MDKDTEKHILNILRQGTLTWHVRNEALNRNRYRKVVGRYKNGKEKSVWFRDCDNNCGESHPLSGYVWEVDHIDPVGSFNGNFDDYARRMFCSLDNLQVLCHSCHAMKSAAENSTRRYQRKQKEELTVEDSHDDQSYLDVL